MPALSSIPRRLLAVTACSGVILAAACSTSSDTPVPDAGPLPAVDVSFDIDVGKHPGGGALLAKGHIFGGTVWLPLESSTPLTSHLVEAGHGLAAMRYSLQRFFESPADLTQVQFQTGLASAFASNPDLPLLDAFVKRGGRILFNFYATPAWLQDKATPIPSVCSNGPDAPAARRPPTDVDLWATQVVVPMVTLVKARFGAGQSFELWNEPTSCSWLGTTDKFNALYAAMVKAVKQVDPTARVGGPSHSETVLAIGTVADPPGGTTPFVKRFIDDASAAKLPLDFITLHSYNVNPATNFGFHEREIATVRTWLSAAGYTKVDVINDEWNYSVYEDLSADNVNTVALTGAFTGATLLAFDAAGYDDQSSQSLVDVGDPPYQVVSPLFASVRALPRASYRVSEWLSKLGGPRVSATSSSPWVRVAATDAGAAVEVFAAAFTPHEQMSLTTAGSQIVSAFPDLAATLAPVQAALVAWLAGPAGAPVPDALAALVDAPRKDALVKAKELFDHERQVRTDWGVGPGRTDPVKSPGRALSWRFDVAGLAGRPAKVVRRTLTSKQGLTQAKTIALYKELVLASVPIACQSVQALKTTLGSSATCAGLATWCQSVGADSSGLGKDANCSAFETFAVEFALYASDTKTMKLLAGANAPANVVTAFATQFAAATAQYQPLYDAMYQRPETMALEEDVTTATSFTGGVLHVPAPAEPFAVVMVSITK